MKTIGLFLIIQLSFFVAYSQCDNPFFIVKEGTKTVTETYNAKGKLEGSTTLIYKEFETTEDGYEAIVEVSQEDAKKKEIHIAEYDFECVDGEIRIDFYSLFPQDVLKSTEAFELEMEATEIMIPSELEVGQVLPDATMSASTANSPVPMKMDFKITNRKVEGIETITTSAGTFECYKITYDFEANVMMVKNTFKGVNYIAKKVGVVKTEVYKENGKLMNYTLLKEFN